jgi:homoserine kinase
LSGSNKKVTAFAPATVANVAVGFDILGFALEGIGDQITVERLNHKPTGTPIIIEGITGIANPLPLDPSYNVATAGLLDLIQDRQLNHGFRVWIHKGIPIASGMGGSAASAIGSLVAVSALLDTPLTRKEILEYALVGEALASGAGHPDNVAPCLYGGLTLVRELQPLEILSIPIPEKIQCVLVHPHLTLETRRARAALSAEVPLKVMVKQTALLGGFLTGCFQNDIPLISRSMKDLIIEPQRAGLISGFTDAKKAALKAGALGASISGSGPSIFAWVDSANQGVSVQSAVTESFKKFGIESDSWITQIDRKGAKIIS